VIQAVGNISAEYQELVRKVFLEHGQLRNKEDGRPSEQGLPLIN